MSEHKHTPGPWYWDSDPVKGDQFGRIRYQVVASGKTIAKTYYSSYEGGLTNAESDTRLMAAAPEMLAALEGVLRVADRQTDEFDAARDAIAKAKGETP